MKNITILILALSIPMISMAKPTVVPGVRNCKVCHSSVPKLNDKAQSMKAKGDCTKCHSAKPDGSLGNK